MNIKVINQSKNKLPYYAHTNDSGFDIMSNEEIGRAHV
jgi:dUTPase